MLFPFKITTETTSKTEDVGEELALLLKDTPSLPRFIAMYGDLGVGKTAFVRGFARVLAPESTVKSPTFALVNETKEKYARIIGKSHTYAIVANQKIGSFCQRGKSSRYSRVSSEHRTARP